VQRYSSSCRPCQRDSGPGGRARERRRVVRAPHGQQLGQQRVVRAAHQGEREVGEERGLRALERVGRAPAAVPGLRPGLAGARLVPARSRQGRVGVADLASTELIIRAQSWCTAVQGRAGNGSARWRPVTALLHVTQLQRMQTCSAASDAPLPAAGACLGGRAALAGGGCSRSWGGAWARAAAGPLPATAASSSSAAFTCGSATPGYAASLPLLPRPDAQHDQVSTGP